MEETIPSLIRLGSISPYGVLGVFSSSVLLLLRWTRLPTPPTPGPALPLPCTLLPQASPTPPHPTQPFHPHARLHLHPSTTGDNLTYVIDRSSGAWGPGGGGLGARGTGGQGSQGPRGPRGGPGAWGPESLRASGPGDPRGLGARGPGSPRIPRGFSQHSPINRKLGATGYPQYYRF